MGPVNTGLDVVLREGLQLPGQGRFGLLCNNATIDRDLRGSPEALLELAGTSLDRIFAPQHGFAGEKQDNMVESSHGTHPATGRPILSLYGKVREPEPEMLDGLDAILVDLQDVGTRVYTFLNSALLVLNAAAEAGVPVWVLDRPNPIGGDRVEGPILQDELVSFVGMIPVPLRHGLTPGEYCRFGASVLQIDVDLQVIPVEGWRREEYHDQTGLPWAMPSPNLPTLDTAIVYPGGVILEGTNLSEGRGTTRPFELWGAPWIEPTDIRSSIEEVDLQGFALREVAFEPTFHKFVNETVRGFQIHVTDRRRFSPVALMTTLFWAVKRCHPDEFAWRDPPYEYETVRLPVDLIAGSSAYREAIDQGAEPGEIIESWRPGTEQFFETRRPHLLYTE